MENQKIKTSTKIILIIGIILAITGFFLFFNTVLGGPGSIHHFGRRLGLSLLCLMSGILTIWITLVAVFLPRIGKRIFKKGVDTIDSINNKVIEIKQKHQDAKLTRCKYCGTPYDRLSSKCPSCGAPNK